MLKVSFSVQMSGIRASPTRFAFDYPNILECVAMMVREKPLSHNLKAPLSQIGEERRRIAYAAKREELFLFQVRDLALCIFWTPRHHRIEPDAGIENRRTRLATNHRFEPRSVAAARDHDDVRARNCGLAARADGRLEANARRRMGWSRRSERYPHRVRVACAENRRRG